MIYLLRYAAIISFTVVLGTLICLVGPFDRSGEFMIRVTRVWASWILSFCGVRVEVEGLENIRDGDTYVFMVNHQSTFDILGLIHTIPVSFRFVAKKELAWVPFFGWSLKVGGHLFLDRGNRSKAMASLEAASEKIRQGRHVIFFPEGTRSQSGELMPFKSGGFRLAMGAQAPIVPVSVSGSHRIHPAGTHTIRSGVVKVVYGKPIPTEGLGRSDRSQLMARVREAIVSGFDGSLQGPVPTSSDSPEKTPHSEPGTASRA